jgi:hypothetical protein
MADEPPVGELNRNLLGMFAVLQCERTFEQTPQPHFNNGQLRTSPPPPHNELAHHHLRWLLIAATSTRTGGLSTSTSPRIGGLKTSTSALFAGYFPTVLPCAAACSEVKCTHAWQRTMAFCWFQAKRGEGSGSWL